MAGGEAAHREVEQEGQLISRGEGGRHTTRALPIVDRASVPGGELPGPTPADYQVIARIAQTAIDPGSPLDIEVYFTGSGLPSAYKFSVVFPKGILAPQADPSKPGLVTYGTITACLFPMGLPDEAGRVRELITYADPKVMPLDDVGIAVMLNRAYFSNRSNTLAFPDMLPQVAGELKAGDHAPLSIRAALSGAAPPGDHVVRMVLTYVSEGKPKTAVQDLVLHVRPFWERPWFQALAVLAAASAIFAAGVTVFRSLVPTGW